VRRFSQIYSELKRRNVFRAGTAYLVLAWLTVQVADILLEAFAAPDWAIRTLIVALAIGFPITLALSWIYEITIEGVKRTEDVLPQESITDRTGRKLDFAVIGLLLVAVIMFAVDRFYWRQLDDDLSTDFYDLSVAVLPFTTASDRVPFFLNKLSDDVAMLLRRDASLNTPSKDAIAAIPPTTDLSAIAVRLGVRYVAEGTIDIADSDICLSVSLFDHKQGKSLWTEVFTNSNPQLVVDAVTDAILVEISGHKLGVSTKIVDADAYQLYLRAQQIGAIEDEWEEARLLYKEALEIEPRFAKALASLCSLEVGQYHLDSTLSKFEDAEQNCHRAWTIDEHFTEVQLALGKLYLQSGQTERARESFEKVLSKNRYDFEAQLQLANSYSDDQPGVAESLLRQLIQIHPGSPNAYVSLQHLLFRQGRYEEAAEYARWAVRLRPHDFGFKWRLSSNLIMAGYFGEAEILLREMIESGESVPGYLAEVESNLAFVLYFQGRFADAAELFRNATVRDPDEPMFHRNLGDAVWHQSGSDAARPIFLKAIEVAKLQLDINPENYWAIESIIVSYASVGDALDATRYQARAIDFAADDPLLHYSLAIAASRLGAPIAAIQHASRAEELGYPTALLNDDPDISAARALVD
jgi:tetratricopeptide (TPR) repeat protein